MHRYRHRQPHDDAQDPSEGIRGEYYVHQLPNPLPATGDSVDPLEDDLVRNEVNKGGGEGVRRGEERRGASHLSKTWKKRYIKRMTPDDKDESLDCRWKQQTKDV